MAIMIQVRNVPDDVHRELKAGAALAGMSLSAYALAESRRGLDRPTTDELMRRLGSRVPVTVEPRPADVIREERARRGLSLRHRPRLNSCCSLRPGRGLPTSSSPVKRRSTRRTGSTLRSCRRYGVLSVGVTCCLLVRPRPYGPSRISESNAMVIALANCIGELRDNPSACDAAYLTLAEALSATLLTCDAALAKVPGVRARIEVL